MKRHPGSYRPLATIPNTAQWPHPVPVKRLNQADKSARKFRSYYFTGIVGKHDNSKQHQPPPLDTRWILFEAWMTWKTQIRGLDFETVITDRRHAVMFYRYIDANSWMLQDITPARAQAWADLLVENAYANPTIRLAFAKIFDFYRWAIDNGKLQMSENPIRKPILPYKPQVRRPAITALQYAVLTKHLKGKAPWDYLAVVGWETGLRIKDASMLKWEQINFERNYLALTPGKTARHAVKVVIPLTAELRAAFELMKGRALTDRMVSPYVAPYLADYVLTVKKAMNISGAFSNHCAKCGLRGITFHSFRHGFVSRLLERGVPPQVVMSMSGHKSLDTVFRYTHVSLQAKIDALEQGNGGKVTWTEKTDWDEYLKP